MTETKLDGYRLLVRIDGKKVRLFTRNGHDWTAKLPTLKTEIQKLAVSSAWIDGEIVVLKDGIPSFSALQDAIGGANNKEINFFLFDLMYLNGKDLKKVPLLSRRAQLRTVLEGAGEHLIFGQDFDALPVQIFTAAAELGLEGLVLKRRDARYQSGRTESWLKAKARLREEFVIVGMTARGGNAGEVGSRCSVITSARSCTTPEALALAGTQKPRETFGSNSSRFGSTPLHSTHRLRSRGDGRVAQLEARCG